MIQSLESTLSSVTLLVNFCSKELSETDKRLIRDNESLSLQSTIQVIKDATEQYFSFIMILITPTPL